MTLLEKLYDLRKQATVERSHYYVGSVVDEVIDELDRLYAIEAATADLLKAMKGVKKK